MSRFFTWDRTLNKGRVIYQQVGVGCAFGVVLGGGVHFHMIFLTNLPVSSGFFSNPSPPQKSLRAHHQGLLMLLRFI